MASNQVLLRPVRSSEAGKETAPNVTNSENKTSMASKAVENKQNGAQVSMKNDMTQQVIELLDSKNWSGKVFGSYPPAIAANSSDGFLHVVDPQNGSKGAVVYSGKINQTTECAWLLAWCAPVGDPDPPKNQVYVETGKKEKYVQIEWNDIEKILDASGTDSNYEDRETGCSAFAEIDEGKGVAILKASFSDTPM